MKITVSDSFLPLLENKSPYLLLCGGAGSGKSEFAGRKVFYRCMKEGNHRFMIMRKIRSRLRESVIAVMLEILESNEIKYTHNKMDRTIIFHNPQGLKNELLFDGLDDPEKIKSIKGITSYWLEETTEFTLDDFTQLDLRLREPTKYYKQILMSFNPDEAAGPWLKEVFFFDDYPKSGPGKREGSYIHPSTIEDNPINEVRREYLKKLERLGDKTYYSIYRLGHWALARGIIYNWDAVDKPEGKFYDDSFYGLDFGYSVDPAAVDRIYRKADEFWLEEIIHETKLTNQQLGIKMRDKGITEYEDIYADSAEPKSIDEIAEMGFNIKPCLKGPDSVKAGIDFLKSKTIHIIKGSTHIEEERKGYKYKEDKDGNPLPVPVKFKNHHMDASRYGIYTHCREPGKGYAAQAGGAVY
jgi:phage terminase large subunit